ncbi:MAG TPA: hypothetical protein VGQ59_11850 [Cyclobacteriaceae bacterium]|jgi:hypothetical protein|nr:hypothetical protein [Cyclobacteriaceae bacterium]
MINYQRLDTSNGFINPRWYSANIGKSFITNINAQGMIAVDGEVLTGCSFPENTEVIVEIGRNFRCCKKADWDKYQEQLNNTKLQKIEDDRILANARRDSAIVFNSKIQLPVKWDVGRKDVLSGLSENSMGNGYRSSTVHHIVLKEDLTSGRLRRKQNDFLCSANGNNGKDWSGSNSEPVRVSDGDNKLYAPKITCRSCLRIAIRFTAK